jgi:hypothetical protein
MHLSGIAAEDRSGATRKNPCTPVKLIVPDLAVSGTVFRFQFVELAKGFEPPTL